MLFRAGAAIATVVFLHGAGNLERDAGAMMAHAGNSLPGGVSAYCKSDPATCLELARQAGTKLISRDDQTLFTAAKGTSTPRAETPTSASPRYALPDAGDSILPPRRKARG